MKFFNIFGLLVIKRAEAFNMIIMHTFSKHANLEILGLFGTSEKDAILFLNKAMVNTIKFSGNYQSKKSQQNISVKNCINSKSTAFNLQYKFYFVLSLVIDFEIEY